MARRSFKAALTTTALFIVIACSPEIDQSAQGLPAPAFAGNHQCASCHSREFEQWQRSHHRSAMQLANAETVLGDFEDRTIIRFDIETRFNRQGRHYYVQTRSSAGEDQQYEVTHTFGVMPLQQYLVDAPGGRKQVLPFAWDSRPESAGGQRWFYPAADEVTGPNDPMHWTGRYFNWNHMCAECHSTDVKPGYEPETDTFATTYAEISVGCEACHGPASRHVVQAERESFDANYGLLVSLDAGVGETWSMNESTGVAGKQASTRNMQEAETCGRCHARRHVVTGKYEYGTALADTHSVSLLEEGLYFPDGRIQDEVFVYGSFIQSKMYAAGVVCSDCHNPHSGELRAGPDPNDTCSTCHLAAKFATTDHNADQVGDCVACHMPATTYMGVDDRRDHSFRLPGTATDPGHYGAIIAAGRDGNANQRLIRGIANRAYPAIARATMLALLEPIVDEESLPVLLQQLDDPDALVRIGALRALRRQAPDIRAEFGHHLLRDPVRSVRIEAALTYIDVRTFLAREDLQAFADAADDCRASMRAALAMPGAAIQLAEFEARLGHSAAAESMYKHALRVAADSAPANHSYGLHLVRSGQKSKGLEYFERAAKLAPTVPLFTYTYGIALHSTGSTEEAVNVLKAAFEEFPEDFNVGWALATMLRDTGKNDLARSVSTALQEQFPDDERIKALRLSLQDL